MITNPERGLTVKNITAELTSLQELHAKARDALAAKQSTEKSELTEKHRRLRANLKHGQMEHEKRLNDILFVLIAESKMGEVTPADTDSGKEGAEIQRIVD